MIPGPGPPREVAEFLFGGAPGQCRPHHPKPCTAGLTEPQSAELWGQHPQGRECIRSPPLERLCSG